MVVAAQNILTFTLGLALVAGGKRSWQESVRSMAQYPFMYFLGAAVLCRACGWTIPVPLLTALQYLGDALVPVALITLGVQVSRIRLHRGLGQVAEAAALRLVGGPLLAYGWIRLLGLHGLLAETLFIGSGVPTAVNVTILSLEYDNEPEFAAQVTLLTTVLSAVTVTILVYLAFRIRF